MAQERDPVGGIMVETANAVGPVTYRERTYFFCTDEHRRLFEANPERFTRERSSDVAPSPEPEAGGRESRRPYTKTDGMTAPRFGSAGSGGLEFEPPPPAGDDPESRGAGG
ncbi:MAG TPA: hypothetical protein VF178_09305 [Gemmatimonadaceae bacterium]